MHARACMRLLCIWLLGLSALLRDLALEGWVGGRKRAHGGGHAAGMLLLLLALPLGLAAMAEATLGSVSGQSSGRAATERQSETERREDSRRAHGKRVARRHQEERRVGGESDRWS